MNERTKRSSGAHARSLASGAAAAARCTRSANRAEPSTGGRDKRQRRQPRASTISTSDTELIDSTYIVTPTSTGGPATSVQSASTTGRRALCAPHRADKRTVHRFVHCSLDISCGSHSAALNRTLTSIVGSHSLVITYAE